MAFGGGAVPMPPAGKVKSVSRPARRWDRAVAASTFSSAQRMTGTVLFSASSPRSGRSRFRCRPSRRAALEVNGAAEDLFSRSISAPEAWISLTVLFCRAAQRSDQCPPCRLAGEVAEADAAPRHRPQGRSGGRRKQRRLASWRDKVEPRVRRAARSTRRSTAPRVGFRSCTTRRCAPSAAVDLSSAARGCKRRCRPQRRSVLAPRPAVTVGRAAIVRAAVRSLDAERGAFRRKRR